MKEKEVKLIQKNLLAWYEKTHRKLPWRDQTNLDKKQIFYNVLTSEIMSQQTKMDTVIQYYHKWMKKFPTIEDLAAASLEEVHSEWAGLGYYRRATNFHKAAKFIVEENKSKLPKDHQELLKLPGVGKYTAGAISSIVFKRNEPLVDGNVNRILQRLLAKELNEKEVWKVAEELIEDCDKPGEFNQSLMEFGSLLCKPKNPICSTCTLSTICKAYEKVENKELSSVEIYPIKKEKKKPRDETIVACVIYNETTEKYAFTKRPPNGLLANLFEFPNAPAPQNEKVENEENEEKNAKMILSKFLESNFNFKEPKEMMSLEYSGNITHIFSHIKQLIHIFKLNIKNEILNDEINWLTEEDIDSSAISTQMKKVFSHTKKKRKRTDDTKQKKIKDFFK
eukprot:gene1389-12009_t